MALVPDVVVCLTQRRWTCYYERPHHLMVQCARERRAVFIEEPEHDTTAPDIEIAETRNGVLTLIPHMPSDLTFQQVEIAQRRAIDFVLAHLGCHNPVLWYYAPKTLAFTDHIDAAAVVYDWIEQDRDATGPVPLLGRRHQQLLDRADVVFTDGEPDHRQLVHHNVHAYPIEGWWEETWKSMWGHVERAITQRRVPSAEACSVASLLSR